MSKYKCPHCGKEMPITARNFQRASLHDAGRCVEAEQK
jgi:DNA-directed RNA polymerase subunit RPC12/RpoP